MSLDSRTTGLVIAREIRETLRRKSFWVITAAVLLVVSALMVVPSLIGSSEDTYDVGVVGDAPESLTSAIEAAGTALDIDITLTSEADETTARSAVRDDDLDAALVVGDEFGLIADSKDSHLVLALRQAISSEYTVTQLESAGLGEDAISDALAPAPVNFEMVHADRSGRVAAASIVSIAVYLLLFIVTMQVANGVATEKSSRVSEVLLAIVSPRSMLFGKVAGVALTALIPLAAGAVPVVIRLRMTSDGLPPDTGVAVAAGAAWFVLGAGFYLFAAGALGSLVERQEDTGSAIAILSILLVGSYVISQGASDTTFGAVLAYLPFSAPMVEPARLALGVSSGIEVAGSLVAGLISVALMARFASVVYERAVVRTGRRLHLRDLFG